MGLITVVLMLVIIGVILYLVTTKIPLDPAVRVVIQVVVVVTCVLWLLRVFNVPDIPLGR